LQVYWSCYRPEEPPLKMTPAHLWAVRAALDEVGPHPERRAFAGFVLWPI
jgi:hypothetical protein